MKKIQFYKLNRFKRLQDSIHSQEFMKELRSNMPCSEENHNKFRAQAREFLRSNGFNVDDDFEWVVWDTKNDYLMSVLRWA